MLEAYNIVAAGNLGLDPLLVYQKSTEGEFVEELVELID